MRLEEEADDWKHRAWYKENLPLPPDDSQGNPERAVTWFKESAMADPLLERLAFYRGLAAKYGLEIEIESTEEPAEMVDEDPFQVGAVRVRWAIW